MIRNKRGPSGTPDAILCGDETVVFNRNTLRSI